LAGFGQSLKTVLLLGALTGLMLFIGGMVGGRTGMTIALGMAVFMNVGSWWLSDKLVIAMTRAQEIPPGEMPGLHRMVEELAQHAGIPKPRVYMTPERSANAFATGRGPGNAVVAVTQGLLNLLDERELRGVLAHEIAHIKDRDILVSSIAATIAGAIMTLAYMAGWFGFFLGGDDDDGGNLITMLLISIMAPIAAGIIQMAISRSREYKADFVGGQISRDPNALADALEKLSVSTQRIPLQNQRAATVHHIVHPFSGRRGRGMASRLFSTHPPMEERVRRLRSQSL
jgi:heat shock protein HtpX